MLILLILVLGILIAVVLFMKQPQFGRVPDFARLERMKRSPFYSKGQFHNINNTPALSEGATYMGVMKEFLFTKNKSKIPPQQLPSTKTNLLQLNTDENILVWFGHSSYFMQLNGKKVLVDPVLSGNAAPVNFMTRSFIGSDVYTVNDIPDIEYLFITHDHYDHLDFRTVKALQPKVHKVITGLGVGAHLERWGYTAEQINELDWNEDLDIENGFKIHAATARHFSGRSLKRNATLWSSFVFSTPTHRIFIGGDSGYDDHFKKIGESHGPFDLVILENGQYDKSWKYIHMTPEEVVQAAEDLKAERLLPVHWSKFTLANHAWDDSIIRVVKEAERKKMPLLHPMIGEKVALDEVLKSSIWWEGYQ